MSAAARGASCADPQPTPWRTRWIAGGGVAAARARTGAAFWVAAALVCGCASSTAPRPAIGVSWEGPAEVDPAVADGPQPEPYVPEQEPNQVARRIRIKNLSQEPVIVELGEAAGITEPLMLRGGGERVVEVGGSSEDLRSLVTSVRSAPPDAARTGWFDAFVAGSAGSSGAGLLPSTQGTSTQGTNEGAPFTQAWSPSGSGAAFLSPAVSERGGGSPRCGVDAGSARVIATRGR